MPIVEVNGEEVEFPDDMTDADIEAVLQKQNGFQARPEEGLESKAVRVTQGMLDPVFGMAQMVPHALSAVGKGINAVIPNDFINGESAGKLATAQDLFNKSREEWYQKARATDGLEGFDGLRMAGNVVSPANLMVASGAAKLAPAKTLLGKIGQGAVTGAGYGVTAPVTSGDYATEKAKQAGMGAAMGGALPVAGEAVARMIKPNTSKNVETLMKEGVRPTPGQILGGSFKTAEDKLMSVPLLGDSITAARQRGIEDSNISIANRALEPIGKNVAKGVKPGRDLINHVEDELGKAYDAIVPGLTSKMDKQFSSEIQNLSQMTQSLGKDKAEQFIAIFKNEVLRYASPNGTISGDSFKRIESVLGQKARGYLKDQNPDVRDLGNAIREAQSSLRSLIARNHPKAAPQLKKINEGWANFERMRGASSMLGAPEGVFSPAQLANNVKKMGGRNQYSRGNAMLQDISDAAKDVLPAKYPDSGTAGRYLLGAGALGSGAVTPVGVGGLLAGAGLYSRPGVAAMEALLAKRPKGAKTLADGVRKLTSPSDLARLLTGNP